LTLLGKAGPQVSIGEAKVVSLKTQIIRASSAGALAVMAVAGFVAPASAATAGVHMNTIRQAAAAKPNSNITGSGKTVTFSPKSIKAKWSGPTEKKCTAKKESFTITNTAKTTETVTLSGKAFAKIAAGAAAGVCAWGTGTTTGTFSLKANTKAVLTVHVS
jgi:hypothetical protein